MSDKIEKIYKIDKKVLNSFISSCFVYDHDLSLRANGKCARKLACLEFEVDTLLPKVTYD